MVTPVEEDVMAATGQTSMHSPQESHFSGIMKAISGDTEISPLPTKAATLEAVAIASRVISLTSFGLRAQPAMNMPSRWLSTGFN